MDVVADRVDPIVRLIVSCRSNVKRSVSCLDEKVIVRARCLGLDLVIDPHILHL